MHRQRLKKFQFKTVAYVSLQMISWLIMNMPIIVQSTLDTDMEKQ